MSIGNLKKVSVGKAHTMHLTLNGQITLCGRIAGVDNNHGMVYCILCQHIYAKEIARKSYPVEEIEIVWSAAITRTA